VNVSYHSVLWSGVHNHSVAHVSSGIRLPFYFCLKYVTYCKHDTETCSLNVNVLGTVINKEFWDVEVEVNLPRIVSRSVCLGVRIPSGSHDQTSFISLTIAGFLIWGTLSDGRMGL
jgi:hypothetical protein